MTDWEKFLERRKANIGFITRGRAFREPTRAELHEALIKETVSWQSTIGKKTFSSSEEYRASRADIQPPLFTISPVRRQNAIEAYIETPMDPEGVLKSQSIDVGRYEWKQVGWFKALLYFIVGRKVRRKND